MSSVWLVMSNSFSLSEEGFHVTEDAARQRAAELTSEAGSEQPERCSVLEIQDTQYEIHRGGSVPDAVWVLVEDREVDPDFGYRVTRASALELLDERDVAGFEYWETSTARAEGVRLATWLQDHWSSSEIVRVQRYAGSGERGEPSAAANRAKDLIRHDTDLPEPMTSVRGDLTTYTWVPNDDTVVEVRIKDGTWNSLVVHKPNARPSVRVHAEEIIHSARWALGVQERVDLRLYTGPKVDASNLDLDV